MSGLMKSVGFNENIGVIVPATSSKPTWNSEGTVSRNSEESEPGAPANKSRSNGNELDVPVTKLSSANVLELMLKVSAYPPIVNGPTVTIPVAGRRSAAEVYQADVGTDEVGGVERRDRRDRPADIFVATLEQQRNGEQDF